LNANKLKRAVIRVFPYVLAGLIFTNLGEAWRLAEGTDIGERLLSFFSSLPAAFRSPFPSLHPADLLTGAVCGALLWLAVRIRHKNAKHFRPNTEYGSARWSA